MVLNLINLMLKVTFNETIVKTYLNQKYSLNYNISQVDLLKLNYKDQYYHHN